MRLARVLLSRKSLFLNSWSAATIVRPRHQRREFERRILFERNCGRIVVEAAGVEPASENVTGQENYMLSRVHAPGITLGRSRPTLRTDKKRVPLACSLSLSSQT